MDIAVVTFFFLPFRVFKVPWHARGRRLEMKRRVRLTPWRRSPWKTSKDSSKDTETRKRILVAGGRPRSAWTLVHSSCVLRSGIPGASLSLLAQ